MTEFKFRCPYCLQKLEADEEWRGEPMECPNCHRQYNIPEKVAASDAAADDADDVGSSESTSSDGLGERFRSGADAGKTFFRSIATASVSFIRKNREGIAATAKVVFHLTLTVFIIYVMATMIYRCCSSGDNAAAEKDPAPAAPVANKPEPAAPAAKAPEPVAYRPPAVEDRKPPRISIHVTVKKKFSIPGEYYKYNCEYKLYADDVCIATKNSTSTMAFFDVKVPKGAALSAEMLGKNGFGGVADSISGPNFGESKPVASSEGQYITIDCW